MRPLVLVERHPDVSLVCMVERACACQSRLLSNGGEGSRPSPFCPVVLCHSIGARSFGRSRRVDLAALATGSLYQRYLADGRDITASNGLDRPSAHKQPPCRGGFDPWTELGGLAGA